MLGIATAEPKGACRHFQSNRESLMLELNIPEVIAEITEAFSRYERALVDNDVAALDTLFWNSRSLSVLASARIFTDTRQSLRTEAGWRIAAAHVSLMSAPLHNASARCSIRASLSCLDGCKNRLLRSYGPGLSL